MIIVRIGIERKIPGTDRYESKRVAAAFEAHPSAEMIQNRIRIEFPGWTIQGWAVEEKES